MHVLWVDPRLGEADQTRRDLGALSPQATLDTVASIEAARSWLAINAGCDLVLADLGSLGADGLGFAEELARRSPPLLLVAVNGPGGVRQLAWLLGAPPAADPRISATAAPAATGVRDRLGAGEIELAGNRDLAATLVEKAPVIILLLDLAGRIQHVNAYFERLTGYSLPEIQGNDWFSTFLPPEDHERIRGLFGTAIQDVPTRGNVNPVMTRAGERRNIEWFDQVIRDRAGAPAGLLAIGQDVTDRGRAEQALRQSEGRLRAILDGMFAYVALYSPDGTMTEVNQHTLDQWGLPREQMIGRRPWETERWANDAGMREALQKTYARVARGERVRADITATVGGGRRVTTDSTLQPLFDDHGNVTQLLSFAVDVTSRKAIEEALRTSEARLREAQRIAQLGSWELDLVSGELNWSDEIYSLFEIDKEQFGASYEAFLNAIHPADREAVDNAYATSVATREPYEITHRLLMKDGRVKYVQERCETHYSADGTPLRSVGTVQDLTDRRQAEIDLRDSQQRYERVVQHISDALILDDVDGRVLFANPRFFELFGIPEERRHTVTMVDYVAPEWRDALVARHRRRMAGKPVPEHLEYEGLRFDRTRIWLEVVVVPVVEDGRMVGTQSTIRDISERKVREDALRLLSTGVAHLSGEAMFQEMASELTRLLALEIGFVGRLIEGAPRRIRTLSWFVDGQLLPSVEYELPDTPCESVIGKETAVFPSGVQESFPADEMLVEMGISGDAAVPLFDSDGQPLGHVGVMSRRPLEHPDRVEAILRLFAVRTAAEIERQRTESQFQDLFKFSPDGIIIVDHLGAITAANPEAESLFGYSVDELQGMSVEELVPDDQRPGHAEKRAGFMSAGIARGMNSGRPNLSARRSDGTTFPVEISLSPMQAEGGPVVVATLRDRTDRVAAEAERDALEAQLRQAQKMEAIGTLAGGIAHDFNNILAAIIGNTELAAMDLDSSHPAMETLGEIRRASNRAKDLVRQILAFSRHQEQPRAVILLEPVAVEVTRLIRATLPAAVEVGLSVDSGSPPVLADASQVHQVLMNLCTNSWHALAGRPGRIEVLLDGVDLDAASARHVGDLQPGRFARLSVTDTGKGMDAATIDRVFEPFFTTKEVGAGTGLGLAVVHGIVRGHGGAITVTSEPGRGSTFAIFLPAAAVAGHESGHDDRAFPRGDGQHILYIDDEAALSAVGGRILEHIGYRATGFTDPLKAIAALRADPAGFDLLLTDLNMPGISGLDVIREAALLAPGLPAALISGFTSAELHAEASALGVLAMINKPVTTAELAETLHRVFANPSTTAVEPAPAG